MTHPFQDLFDRIPKLNCTGECGRRNSRLNDTCCGPIGCTALEADWLDGFDGIKAEWDSCGNGNVNMDIESLFPMRVCPHLGIGGRCTAYEARPLICRLWGVVERMKCPYGCRPERYMTEKEVNEIFNEAERRNQLHLEAMLNSQPK